MTDYVSELLPINYTPMEDCEHDDVMTADDYERREYERNGWNESRYDPQRY
jgi:hypothetical protein